MESQDRKDFLIILCLREAKLHAGISDLRGMWTKYKNMVSLKWKNQGGLHVEPVVCWVKKQ